MSENAAVLIYVELIKEDLKTSEARAIIDSRAESLAKEALRLADCFESNAAEHNQPHTSIRTVRYIF